MVLILAWACTGGTDTASDTASSAFLVGDATLPDPGASLEEVQDEMQAVVDDLGTWNAGALLERYDSWMERTDDSCPTWSEREQDTLWTASCTSTAGASFLGTSTERNDAYSEDVYDVSVRELEASAELSDDSTWLLLEGTVQDERRTDTKAGHVIYKSNLHGRFGADDDAWLEASPSTDFRLQAWNGEARRMS
ncbi:MAG: hypothetical protein GY884_08050, partial [Proteobacteria bacterium]|nr:hypothetical protein [Pseudomonadota bacterium]